MVNNTADDSDSESYLDFMNKPDPASDAKTSDTAAINGTPRFSAEEERQIEVELEVRRRFRDETQVVEPEIDTTPLSFEGEYPATRKHILSFFASSSKRLGQGVLAIALVWLLALYVPNAFFDAQPGSEMSWNIGLIAAGMTALIVFVVFLLEIKSFMQWKNWRLEVTDTEVIIDQEKSIIGRLNEVHLTLRRNSVETVNAERKWYLLFLNIYTVSFDAPGDQDMAFHNMKYVMNGKLLEELFTQRRG